MTRSIAAIARCFSLLTLALSATFAITPSAQAQQKGAADALPTCQLHSLSPAGGKQGASLEVKIASGADTERVSKLLFSHTGIKAEPKLGDAPIYGGPAEPIAGAFVVTIAKDVPPGLYDVRAVGYFGVSNPRTFVVSQNEELLESPDNNSFAKAAVLPMGAVVNGQATAANADYFKFAAKQGQRVLCDVWAQRIDSKMDATLVVYDATGRELARNRDMNRRDPLVDIQIPADGEYVVAVYDFLYEGSPDHFYRLQVHTGPYIDFVYPPVGEAGTKGTFTVYGRNLPGGKPSPILIAGRAIEQLSVTIDVPKGEQALLLDGNGVNSSQQAMLDGLNYRLTTPQGTSNPYFIGIASAAVILEKEPNDDAAKAQEIKVPCEYVGQFKRRGDDAWVQFQAKKGDVYIVEVISQRLGLPTDPQVIVQRVTTDPKGEVKVSDVTELDDDAKDLGGAGFPTANGDGAYRLQVADDGLYRVLVRDLHGSVGDPRRVFRLSIRQPQPDFRVAVVSSYPTLAKDSKPWSNCLRRGGAASVDVIAFRRDGFAGEIEISVEGLPKGLTAAPVTLGADQESSPLVIQCAADAPAWTGTLKVVGKAKLGEQNVVRVARNGVTSIGGVVGQNNQPGRSAEARVCRELALSVHESETLPLSITIGDGKPVEMSRGGKLEIPVKVERREGFKEALTLTPVGIPAAFKAQNVTIAAGANEGKLTFEIPANTTPGSVAFNVRGPAKMSYKRDVTGADAAAATKKAIEKLAAETDVATKAAEKAKVDTEAKAKEAQAALAKATDANRAELQKKMQEADENKVKAVAAATASAAKLKAANDAKTAADKRATDMATAAKPKDLNVIVPSSMALLKVTATPVTLAMKAPTITVKLGANAEAIVVATRLYNYADPIELELMLPPELKKVKITTAPIAKGSNEGKLQITAEKDATPGTYQITLRGKPKLNNQPLQVDQTFALKVE